MRPVDDAGRPLFAYELVRLRVPHPGAIVRGMRCSVPTLDYIQVCADPCPFPRTRLFRWSRRRA